jgi:hypothetical protein
MRGSIIKYQPKNGKPTFGYSFVDGRDEKSGKRIQRVKRGFARKREPRKPCAGPSRNSRTCL